MAFKITLLSPQNSPAFQNINSTFNSLPPQTGLAILASVTKRKLKSHGLDDVSISAYDNPSFDRDNIARFAASDLLGISTIFSNYSSSLRWAQEIRKINSRILIVFGGPYATNLNGRILLNHTEIDYVVSGDGEDVLWRIVMGEQTESIPNLCYRRDDARTKMSSIRSLFPLSEVGNYDFSCFPSEDLRSYLSAPQGTEGRNSQLPIVLSWIRGCSQAERFGRCSYCSISGKSVRVTPPDIAWEQLQHLHDTYGVTSFFESGDNFLVHDYPEQLLNSPNRISGIKLRAYIIPTEFSSQRAATLKELGVGEVYIGIENPDPKVMEWSGHKISEQILMRTLKILKENNISSTIAFLFGLPGESNESLKRQERLAREINDNHFNVSRILISLGIPLIGSRWFTELEKDAEINANVLERCPSDLPDYSRLLEKSVKSRCSVSLEKILQTMERISQNVANNCSKGSFGGLENWIDANKEINISAPDDQAIEQSLSHRGG